MKAQQFIYTACGKNKNGAFSVWSKSEGISNAESNEIIKLMTYKKIKDAPYDPTEEELKTRFPKKLGYLILPTGRVCIAQSSYTGRVYSDLDKRLGNFIIHAYIFDKSENFCPFFIFGSNIFKTELTYNEWHDLPCPESLPVADIDIKPNLDQICIKDFLANDSKRSIFTLILQSIINSQGNNSPVTFNFDEKDQRAVYELLGLTLPQKYYKEATFLTQYDEQEYYFVSNNIPPIKIRNIFDAKYNFSFNYSTAVNDGQYAFYFEKGLFANVKTGHYVDYIGKLLQTGSLSDICNNVSKLMDTIYKYNCTPDSAVDIYNLLSYRLETFETPEEFNNIVALTNGIGYDKALMLEAIYKRFASGSWNFDGRASKLINYVFVNGNNQIKDEFIKKFFESINKFGANFNLPYDALVEDIKQVMPFDYIEVVKSLYRNRFSYERPIKDDKSAILVFDSLCIIANSPNCDKFAIDAVYRGIAIYERTSVKNNSRLIEFLFRDLNSLKVDRKNMIIDRLFKDIFDGVGNESDMKDALDWILMVCEEADKVYLLEKFIERFENCPFLFPYYAEFSVKNKTLSEKAEQQLKISEKFKDFFIAKENYIINERKKQFRTARVSEEELDLYFKEVYSRGGDRENLYLIKLKEYINDSPMEEERAKRALRLYNKFSGYSYSEKTVVILIWLEEFIFKSDMSKYLNADAKIFDKGRDKERNIETFADNIKMRCRSCMGRPDIIGKCDCIFTLLLFNGRCDGNTMRKAVNDSNSVYGLGKSALTEFIKYHAVDALNGYQLFKKKKIATKEILLVSFFGPILSLSDVSLYIERALDDLSKNANYEIIADIADYCFNERNNFAVSLYNFFCEYTKKLDCKQTKKLSDKIRKLTDKDRNEKIDIFFDNLIKMKKNKDKSNINDESTRQRNDENGESRDKNSSAKKHGFFTSLFMIGNKDDKGDNGKNR